MCSCTILKFPYLLRGTVSCGRPVRSGSAGVGQQPARLHQRGARCVGDGSWLAVREIALLYVVSRRRFTAKLVRVRPDGVAEFLCVGVARSSALFTRQPYAADEVHLWSFAAGADVLSI